MPTFNTDVAAGQLAVTTFSSRDRVEGQRVTGDIRYLEATYTTTATEASNDLVRFGILPIGAYLLTEKCWVFSEGTGGTTVVFTSIGDEADNARYATADLALTAASSAVLPVVPLAAVMLTRPIITSAMVTIVGVLSGTLPMTINKKVIVHLEYRMP